MGLSNTPQARVEVNGMDITALITDRLLMIQTIDKAGMEADQFEIRLDDRDGKLSLPARGAVLSIYLGYTEQSVGLVGQYTVDEIEYAGPPDSIVLRGKSASMQGSGKSTCSGSWDTVPLSQIVADVAGRNGWTPLCSVTDVVERADQVKESDFHFITRIARQHGCTAKLGNGKLIIVPLGMASSGSGKSISAVTLTRSDLTRFQFQLADRSAMASVKTSYIDWASGKLELVDVANPSVPDGLPGVHVWTDTCTRIAPPPSVPPRLASMLSTSPLPGCVWKCRGAQTYSQSVPSPSAV